MSDRKSDYLTWAAQYEPGGSQRLRLATAGYLQSWVKEGPDDDLRHGALVVLFADAAEVVACPRWTDLAYKADKILEYLRS